MATYRFELNNKQTRNKKFQVLLCITINGKRKRIKTDIEVNKKSDWNSTPKGDNWIRPSEPNFKVWNQKLADIINEAKNTSRDIKNVSGFATSEKVASKLRIDEQEFSFIKFAEDFAQRTLEAGNTRTYTKYITFINKLKFFINNIKIKDLPSIPKKSNKEYATFIAGLKNDLLFKEITLSFLNKFKLYLQKTPSSRDKELTLHTNTISKQFDIFKSLYNKGRIELKEEGLSIINNPLEDFTYETINTNKEKLTLDEINRMNALELQENSSLWHTRNCFMFAFYCAGMRAGDLIQLRGTNIIYNNNEWRISYRMDKTSVAKEILLLPQATEILKHYVDFNQLTPKYIFPLLDNDAIYSKAITWEMKERLPFETKAYLLRQVNSKNSLLNKNLAKLAELAEIEKKVTMHIARHSFANIARQKNANLYDISKSLGHSSLKITETYLSNFDTESQDKTMKQVFNEPITEEMKKEQLIEQLKQLSSDKLAELLKRIE